MSIAHDYRKAMQTCKIYNSYFIFATEKTKAIKSKKLKFKKENLWIANAKK